MLLFASHPNSPRAGSRTARLALVALLAGALAACGSVDRTGRAFWQPYRPNVQQGNWITQQQIAQLRPGMTREQVRFVLGTPTLTPVFHADRWDYPYFLKPGYGPTQERRFTVYFENDRLVRWEGDPQPRVQPFQEVANDADEAAELNPERMQERERIDATTPAPGETITETNGTTVLEVQNNSLVDPATQPEDQVDPNTGSVPLR